MDWQTPLALAIVAFTLFLLIRSTLRKKKNGACGGGCCDKKSAATDLKPTFPATSHQNSQKSPHSAK